MRDVYWKVYNNLYISAQDSLIAAFLKVIDNGKNIYARYELECFFKKTVESVSNKLRKISFSLFS